jgi:hypothetical protein
VDDLSFRQRELEEQRVTVTVVDQLSGPARGPFRIHRKRLTMFQRSRQDTGRYRKRLTMYGNPAASLWPVRRRRKDVPDLQSPC